MKLTCNVEVINRSLHTGHVPRRKPQRSCLAIGKQSVKSNELHFLLQTAQNKQGTKYKIDDNIDKVFTKFVNDGKATIRLKEPPHDLNINSDSIQLKSFLHILKLGLGKNLDASVLSISNLNPKSLAPAPKTKVTIKSKADYPVLQGFPRTTEELNVVGLERKSFDRQILRLQSLRVLNLSENFISSLPKELGTLPHLNELNVSKNCLGRCGINKWTWLSEKNLMKNLRLLDLSGNQLEHLPNQVGKLSSLVTLNISDNHLRNLPLSIGILPVLKYLDVSRNKISAWPGSMRNLRLVSVSISDNPSELPTNPPFCSIRVPSLKEFGARLILRHRISYDASIIPFTLVNYLDNAGYCLCGTACINTYVRKMISMDLKRIATTVTSSGETIVPFDCIFCSVKFHRPCFSSVMPLLQ